VNSLTGVAELKHIFRAMWKSYDTEFQGILQSLEQHKNLVERRASVDQYRRHREDMQALKAKIDDQVAAEKLKKLVLIREWLAVGSQPSDDHTGYQEIRKSYSTTARWILERDAIKEWSQDLVPATPSM
jgi:small nuclear ribonucleoprotein (snRNP)-like protein